MSVSKLRLRKPGSSPEDTRVCTAGIITASILCPLLAIACSFAAMRNYAATQLPQTGAQTIAVVREKSLSPPFQARYLKDSYLVRFTYSASGHEQHGSILLIGDAAQRVNPGDQFNIWYDVANPALCLTPWKTVEESPASPAFGAAGLLIIWMAILLLCRRNQPRETARGGWGKVSLR